MLKAYYLWFSIVCLVLTMAIAFGAAINGRYEAAIVWVVLGWGFNASVEYRRLKSLTP